MAIAQVKLTRNPDGRADTCGIQRPAFVIQASPRDVLQDNESRKSSPTFGEHVALRLDGENNERLLGPNGFADDFCTRQSGTIGFYEIMKSTCSANLAQLT